MEISLKTVMAIKSYQSQADALVKNYLLADRFVPYTSVLGGMLACKLIYDLTQLVSNFYIKSYLGLTKIQRVEWNNRGMSTIHAIYISIMSLYFVFWSDLFSDQRHAGLVTFQSSTLSTFILGVFTNQYELLPRRQDKNKIQEIEPIYIFNGSQVPDLLILQTDVIFSFTEGSSKKRSSSWDSLRLEKLFEVVTRFMLTVNNKISVGYFLADLGLIVWLYPSLGGMEYVVHHSLSGLGVAYSVFSGEGQLYTYMVLISEITTPEINMRWFLDTAGMKRSCAYLINGIVIFFAWLVARILLFGYTFYHVYLHYDQVIKMHVIGYLLVFGVPTVLGMMNLMWFGKIVKGLMKTISKRQ